MTTVDEIDPLEKFGQAGKAREVVQSWADGAKILSLLAALRAKGWTEYLAVPRTNGELAAYSGLTPGRVADLVAVLESHGVVEAQDGRVRLTAAFAALDAPDSYIGLEELLDHATVTTRLIPLATDPGALPLTEADALVVARAAGGKATAVTRALYDRLFLPKLPELPDVVRTDRWLDVGCGVAGATLTLAGMFPELDAVAIELVPAVAAETRRRAEAQGVSDRVDVRSMDARDFDEKDAFGGAFWAQPFFPESSRVATLEMMLRALKPGGLLFVQEMEPVPDEAERPAYTLRRLVAQGWGVPFGRTAEELTDEAVAAGFELVRIATTDFGRIVVVRRPL